eukprot:gene1804-3501_t
MGSGVSTSSLNSETISKTVIVCHSKHEHEVHDKLFSHYVVGYEILTDKAPTDLQVRAQLMVACAMAIVIVDEFCMGSKEIVDAVSFLKSLNKIIVAAPYRFYFRPSGALGAICFAYGTWNTTFYDSSGPQLLSATKDLARLKQDVFFISSDPIGSEVVEIFMQLESQGSTMTKSCGCNKDSHKDDLSSIANSKIVIFVITETWNTNSLFRIYFEAAMKLNKIIIPINTSINFERGWLSLAMAGKLLYEVNPTKINDIYIKYNQIEGNSNHVSNSESCLATDFLNCINGLLTHPPVVNEAILLSTSELLILQHTKERALILGLTIEEIESVCEIVESSYISTPCVGNNLPNLSRFGIPDSIEELENKIASSYIHPTHTYLLPQTQIISNVIPSITDIKYEEVNRNRIDFIPPPPIVDIRGTLIPNLQLDVVFSYHSSSSHIKVFEIYQQGLIYNLHIWLDVAEYMQGNINDVMSSAIEHASCVVIFLTKDYIESINCKLELLYAQKCHKHIIFVFLENPSVLIFPTWLREIIGETYIIYPNENKLDENQVHNQHQIQHQDRHVHNNGPSQYLMLDFTKELYNDNNNNSSNSNISMTEVLFGAIKKLVALKHEMPLKVVRNGSFLLYATTCALFHTIQTKKLESPISSSSVRSSVPASLHTSGRLPVVAADVQQQEQQQQYEASTIVEDILDTIPASHMDAARIWRENADYDTFTFEPNPE